MFELGATLYSLEMKRLTKREREVLRLLCDGLTYKELAARLTVSINTVRTHLKRIYAKLGARSRTDAVVTWLRSGADKRR